MKNRNLLSLPLLLSSFFFASCEKEIIIRETIRDTIETIIIRDSIIYRDIDYLGCTQTNFKPDTIYRALEDGFLYVEFVFIGQTYRSGAPTARIESDTATNPKTIAGQVFFSTTLPIQKNNYWKVVNLTKNLLKVHWTPIY
jgi:hypothetical protein